MVLLKSKVENSYATGNVEFTFHYGSITGFKQP